MPFGQGSDVGIELIIFSVYDERKGVYLKNSDLQLSGQFFHPTLQPRSCSGHLPCVHASRRLRYPPYLEENECAFVRAREPVVEGTAAAA